MNQAATLKEAIDKHLHELPFASLQPANLYEPMHYLLGLKGKRIRPILTMMAYAAVSGRDPMEAMRLSAALELFHNFTLMHDDIMDRAPMRRGQPTVHTKWNEDVAILSGDALFAWSMGEMVAEFPQHAAALVEEYTRVSLEVCEGQMEDMDFASQKDVSIDAYLEMIRKKTAALLGGCLRMGAIAAGADIETQKEFQAFGESMGIAFQLQDDLMDAFPPENFGKQLGGDIIECKKTYLTLKAFSLAGPEDHAKLSAHYEKQGGGEEKVKQVLAIFEGLNIDQITRQLIGEYVQKARNLSQSLSEKTAFAPLKSYLQEIADRKL
ncbi:MAG: polyprenyl synthetase family protein [Bacteroidota bacterium]